jgi:2-polyprenyl-3-methyl-5-hydroxy-6-metoxy-1,4-benzoquinol methylase/uncharacterized protein YbaR (Trm112 family)
MRCKVISTFIKNYGNTEVEEIKDAIFFSETGLVFPVINGIPRMLIESIYDYSSFLQQHLSNYASVKKTIDDKYSALLKKCIKKNHKTKASFEFEWSFLQADQNDKIWHEETFELTQRFLSETASEKNAFLNKKIIDAGCGHGIMTTKIAELSGFAVGVELSKAVEQAYLQNKHPGAHYLQGDLQFLPFETGSFDVLYSSGVLHHTNDTRNSLLLVEPVLKKEGRICLWLYHPQQSLIHNLLLQIRAITKRLPVKMAFLFLSVFLFPFSFLIKKVKNKRSVNYREEMIDLLDGFTPEFRHEITHETATEWLRELGYHTIQITTTDQFGFAVSGVK